MRRVDVATAAKGARVPARTLRRWITEGRLTAVSDGYRWWVWPHEVEQLLAWRERAA
jgi:predicted site-specific integrase-resolvase